MPGGRPIKNAHGRLDEARQVILQEGITGEVAETIIALCRKTDRVRLNRPPKVHRTPEYWVETRREWHAQWLAAHRDEMKAYNAAYRAAHLFEIREREREYQRRRRAEAG